MGAAQLARCRLVDYRIRGYRAPQSVLAPELRDQSLCWQNFEWFASSAASLGMRLPSLRARLARLPIHFDDYGLHRGELTWDAWRTAALDMARQEPYVAFGLHDCYAPHWLPRYQALLDELAGLDGVRLRTLDDLANDLHLAAGV